MSVALRRKPRKLIVARGSLFDGEAPYAAISHLDEASHRARPWIAGLVALAAHGLVALAVLFQHKANERPPPKPPHREIATAIVRAQPKPQPPPPTPPPPAPHEHVAVRAPQHAPATPPPPAQAGKAIAVEGPADMTSFELVVGQGTTYAGGTSSSAGTNKEAVHEQAQIGAPPKPARAAPDLSRQPKPARRDWASEWPPEAQDSDLREAYVTLRIHISRDGTATQVEVLAAPAGPLGEAAKRGADAERYSPGLDANGAPIDAVLLLKIHYVR
jgi:hypothetical protein